MPTLIIVAFQYEKTPKELQSMIMDIYLVYSFYRDLDYKIFIASDAVSICSDINPTKYLVDGIIDQHYIPFARKKFLDIRKYVTTRQELVNFFEDVQITEDRRVILYYTGHGTTGGIILPNDTVLPSFELRSMLFNIGHSNKKEIPRSINGLKLQILIIMDCCNPHGLYLPYKILSNEAEINQSNLFISPDVILLVPCNENSPTLAQNSISPFTYNLIETLKNPSLLVDIPNIIKRLSSKQNCLAYVSYPHLMVLWPWTFTNIIDCHINEKLDSIVLKHSNSQYK